MKKLKIITVILMSTCILTACTKKVESVYSGSTPGVDVPMTSSSEAADPFKLEDGTIPERNPYQEAESLLTIPVDSTDMDKVAQTMFDSYVTSFNEMAEEGSKILDYKVKKVKIYGDANEFAALYTFDMTGEENCPYLLGGSGKIDGDTAKGKTEGLRIRKEEGDSYAIIARGEAGIAVGLEE